jgi:hypothetical protein
MYQDLHRVFESFTLKGSFILSFPDCATNACEAEGVCTLPTRQPHTNPCPMYCWTSWGMLLAPRHKPATTLQIITLACNGALNEQMFYCFLLITKVPSRISYPFSSNQVIFSENCIIFQQPQKNDFIWYFGFPNVFEI